VIFLSSDQNLLLKEMLYQNRHPNVAIPMNTHRIVSFQTTLPDFRESEFSVVRQHEEFIWLHDRYVENEDYAGIIVSTLLVRQIRKPLGDNDDDVPISQISYVKYS
jgi:hypothetical protein